jgi:hypothetical protein
MGQMILSAEKLKLDTYKANEQEFLKVANVDPVFVLSQSAREVQAKLLDDYNTRWGKVMKDRGGNMTTEDKVKMAKEKDYILMEQSKMASDMEQAQLHNKMVSQNPNRWDRDEQAKRFNDYITTGSYDHTEPPIKPLSLTDAAMKMSNKVATKEYIDQNEPQQTYSVGGVPYKKSIVYSASREDVAPYIQAAIADNDQYGAGVLKEWNDLAPTDKEVYFSKNPKNPILEMAVDKHWKEWVKSEEKEVKNTQPSNSGLGFSFYTGSGKRISYTPQPAREVPIGKTTYSTFHEIPNLPADDLISKGNIRVLDGEGDEVTQPNINIPSEVVGYDEATDELIFMAKSNFIDIGGYKPKGSGLRFAVKRADAGTKYNDIEIIKDGKKVKIGTLTPSAPKVSVDNGGSIPANAKIIPISNDMAMLSLEDNAYYDYKGLVFKGKDLADMAWDSEHVSKVGGQGANLIKALESTRMDAGKQPKGVKRPQTKKPAY